MSSTDAPTEEAEVAPPTDHARNDLVARLTARLGEDLVESRVAPGDDLWVRVTRDAWVGALEFAKGSLGCAYFSFLSGIDWLPSPFGRDMDAQVDVILDDAGESTDAAPATPGESYAGGDTRFQVFARVNDIVNGLGITFKVDIPDSDLSLPTLVEVYPGANWHERECAEMYGISFAGHPNPAHLYLPGEFEGNPLRKDYPLLSRRMKPWPGIVDVEQMPDEESNQ